MTLIRARELALVTEALCTIYRSTGRPLWSHHVVIARWMAYRIEPDRPSTIWAWMTKGGQA